MKFTVNDKTYFVKWEYQQGMTINLRQTKVTVCKIYNNNTSYNDPIVEESVSVYYKDKFCKNIGRKISLERALDKLFTVKEFRAIAWKEYFNESPKRLK